MLFTIPISLLPSQMNQGAQSRMDPASHGIMRKRMLVSGIELLFRKSIQTSRAATWFTWMYTRLWSCISRTVSAFFQ